MNLESIKLNLERSESETRMRLQNSVTALEQQCELLRRKLDMEEDRYRQAVKSFDDRQLIEQAALKAAEDRSAQLESQCAKLQESLAAAESRSRIASPVRRSQVSRMLSATPGSGGESDSAGAASEQLIDLRTQLVESRTEVENVKEQLELARQQVEQYRAIASSMEEELKHSNDVHHAFRSEVERREAGASAERQ